MVAAHNIKFDPNKQKIVVCDGCKKEIVIGKFSKNNQRCAECDNVKTKSKKNSSKIKPKPKDKDKDKVESNSFGSKLVNICKNLGYEVTDKRSWKKRYAMDGGGISTIYIMPEQGITGLEPRVEYFSLIIQRAVGINEDFRKFMPPDAASDCEVIASELGTKIFHKPKIGQEVCSSCGDLTDEFGVDNKEGKLLCIKPNNCFKKHYTSSGAEALE